ncbi:hypothetical protein NL108_002682, partial [Boleophthalmus pectinirostris]
VLVGDRVRCPFHGACFNVKTGDIEDYPGLDSLPSTSLKYRQNTDKQKYNRMLFNYQTMMQTKRVKEMCSVTPDLKHTIVLIGGGPASLVCAETLRQNNYKGRIIMITKDSLPPFDKPKLSKAMNEDSNNLLLRSRDFFHEFGIDLWTQKEVISVNTADKVMKLSDDSLQPYDQLLIATGCRARPLSCPGWDLEGVMLLQSYKDAKEIHTLSVGRKAVVIGTSFIGMEAASYLSNKAASVAVVGTSVYPFERSLGREIGQMTMQMLEEHSVKFYMKSGVSEIRGHNGKVIIISYICCIVAKNNLICNVPTQVKEVVLKDGQVLEADVVILGIGVIPNSDFLQGSGVEIDSRKAVIVNKLMMTNAPDVFSAGDVTAFPLTIRRDQIVSIGHWQMSHAH